MQSFLFLYFLEGSIRKYLVQSQLLILLKFIPLIAALAKCTFRTRAISRVFLPLVFISVALALQATVHYTELYVRAPLYAAIYDAITLWFVPLITVILIWCKPKSTRKSIVRFLRIVLMLCILNSLMIIAQVIAGPTSILNLTVVADLSFHRYGYFAFKAPGLFSSPNPFIIPLGLFCLLSLRHIEPTKFFISPLLYAAIALVSIAVNLSSRTYLAGSILFSLIVLLSFRSVLSPKRRTVANLILFILVCLSIAITVSPMYSNSKLSMGIEESLARSIGADDPIERIITSSLSPIYNAFFHAPLFDGAGIGSTANFQNIELKELMFAKHESCSGYLDEGEVSRIICSFGFVGILTILFFRIVPGILFLINSRHAMPSYSLFNPFYIICSIIYLTSSLPLKANDVFSALVALCVTFSLVYSANENS